MALRPIKFRVLFTSAILIVFGISMLAGFIGGGIFENGLSTNPIILFMQIILALAAVCVSLYGGYTLLKKNVLSDYHYALALLIISLLLTLMSAKNSYLIGHPAISLLFIVPVCFLAIVNFAKTAIYDPERRNKIYSVLFGLFIIYPLYQCKNLLF